MGGPLTYWDNIEEFLKNKYPAVHRGYRYGEENAASALDNKAMKMPTQYSPWPNSMYHPEYETGPEAVEKHGYDPRQVAAGFMYLHTNAHMTARPNSRVPLLSRDIERLSEIFQKRQQMQRDYEERQRTAMPYEYPKRKRAKTQSGILADGTIERVRGEFSDWWDQQDHRGYTPNPAYDAAHYWSNVEKFLKDKYPAAHRGLSYGYEQARPLLKQKNDREWGDVPDADPYDAGPEAIEKYGYDPAEIAAAMLYLHNDRRSGRQSFQNADRNLLMKVIRTRHKMQQEYDAKPRQLELPLDLQKAASAIRFAEQVMDDYAPIPMQLHRGIGFRKGDLPPELEQRVEAALAGSPDPQLAQHLLDHMERGGEGMGGFWSHSKDGPWLAEGFSRRVQPSRWENHPADYSVVLSADWDGNGSIHDWDTDPDYRKLVPGAGINVTKVRLTGPGLKKSLGKREWIDLGGDPHPRFAAVLAKAADALKLAQRTLTDEERIDYERQGWRGEPCEDPDHKGRVMGRCSECGRRAAPPRIPVNRKPPFQMWDHAEGAWAPRDEGDGRITLYHRTTPEVADAIVRNQKFLPGKRWYPEDPDKWEYPPQGEDEIWFSTHPDGKSDGAYAKGSYAEMYGHGVVRARVPVEKVYFPAVGIKTQPGDEVHAYVYPEDLEGVPLGRHGITPTPSSLL